MPGVNANHKHKHSHNKEQSVKQSRDELLASGINPLIQTNFMVKERNDRSQSESMSRKYDLVIMAIDNMDDFTPQ